MLWGSGVVRIGAAALVVAAVSVVPAGASGPAAGASGPDSGAWATLAAAAGVRFVPLDPTQPLAIGDGHAYAGELSVVPDGDGLAVVNTVGVEDYIDGIAEMPASWPAAALEAQAIAARSYALNHVPDPSPDLASIGAQICATQACQVYAGLDKTRAPDAANWVAAVVATAGQVLEYRGVPIDAMYSSSDGGQTVTGGAPYLWSIPDPDDAASPLHRWEVDIALTDVATALGLPVVPTTISRTGDSIVIDGSAGGGAGAGPVGAPPPGATTTSTPPAPSTTTTSTTSTTSTTVLGAGLGVTKGAAARGTAPAPSPTTTGAPATTAPATTAGAPAPAPSTIDAADFTSRVNGALPPAPGRDVLLPSDRFTVSVVGGNAVFDGGGFGHGVGMSQYGALGKALRGLSADQILAAYYGGLQPTALAPQSVAVAIVRHAPTVTVTGRFRVVDQSGRALATVGEGTWLLLPAPHAQLDVVPPASYLNPFALTGVDITAQTVLPGQPIDVRFNLPLPALVAAAATPPGAGPTHTAAAPAEAGPQTVTLPAASLPGAYHATLTADPGNGRAVSIPIDFAVAAAGHPVPAALHVGAPLGARVRSHATWELLAAYLVAVVAGLSALNIGTLRRLRLH